MKSYVDEQKLGFMDILSIIVDGTCRSVFQLDSHSEEVICLAPWLVTLTLLVTRTQC